MVNFSSSVGGIKKLNNSNYNNWSTRIWFYLLGQELWDIYGGKDTTPSANVIKLKEQKIKVNKALYILVMTIKDEWLQHIKSVKTPKEGQDVLVAVFARINYEKLQYQENKLLLI